MSAGSATLPAVVGAVLYVRVSTKEQTENLSLPTQLRSCEEYCRRQGYEVIERFTEEGESAKTTDRTELQRLLKYCRTHRGRVQFVIVYNLTRFAREKYDHFALRAHLKSLGISLRSATEPIDDTSTGKLMEGVLAAFAQFDNDVRSERVKTGMRAALELGRWTFRAPLGYLNAPKWSAQTLLPDPDRASLIARAFEEYAGGHHTMQDVLAKVTALGLCSRRGAAVNKQSFALVLRNPLYAGVVTAGGVTRRGTFDPLISEATFYRVQALLDGRVVSAGPRQRNHPDFPLRGFVRCEACSRLLTGSWSRSRNGSLYAYYHCQGRCRTVNVAKAVLESAFIDVLTDYQPSAGFMRLVADQVLTQWRELRADARQQASESERQVKALQVKLDRLDDAYLFERAIDRDTYDRHRAKLHEAMTLAKIDSHADALHNLDVEGILAFAEAVLPSAAHLWTQAGLDQQQRLQAIFFPQGLSWEGTAFNRTAVTAWFLKPLAVEDGVQNQNGRPLYPELEPWLRLVDGLRQAA